MLCEKPMAVNAPQAQQMVDVARSSGAFLMEAMWTRHLPVFGVFRRWIDEGRVGEIRVVEASLGFSAPYDPTHRLWAPGLAGGSLLDVGIYPLTLAELAFDLTQRRGEGLFAILIHTVYSVSSWLIVP